MISPPSDRPAGNPTPTGTAAKGSWRVGTLSYTKGGLVLLFCWLLAGDFAWSVRDRAVPQIMQILFKRFGASDLLTGVIFSSLPAAIGMIVGPIVGYKSDRLRSGWGRRIPFLIIPIPFIVVSTIGLAFSPQLGARLNHLLGPWSWGLNPSVLLLIALFWTVFEICCLASNSVFSGLVNDVVPEVVLGRFYGLFRALGLIAGIVFFFKLMGVAEAHSAWVFLGIAALYGIGFSLMCLKVKEGEYPPPPAASPGRFSAVRTYFKEGFSNSYYYWFFAAIVFGGLAALPFNLYSYYYAQSIGMGTAGYGKYIALTYTCSLLLSYPLGICADRFHPLRVSMVCLALYAAVMVCGGVLVGGASSFAFFFLLHGVVSGSFFTASASIWQRILPRAKFAEIGSVAGVLGGIGTMIAAPAVGAFLDHAHHDYRCTFYISAALTALAFTAYLGLYRRFIGYGGPDGYVAPV